VYYGGNAFQVLRNIIDSNVIDVNNLDPVSIRCKTLPRKFYFRAAGCSEGKYFKASKNR
jgi:hypothetical protein